MINEFCENTLVQGATVDLLRDELGWNVDYAKDREVLATENSEGTFGRTSQKQIILPKDFKAAVKALNPWITPDQIETVLETLESVLATNNLISINKEKYYYIRDGIPLETKTQNGEKVERKVQVIDFEHPENKDLNNFRAVQELWIKGPMHTRRTDVIGFVNGIPLLFVELKKDTVDVENAYKDNYRDYLDTIPQLFYYNAFLMLSNGDESKVGTLNSPYKFFHDWKRLDESEEEGSTDAETMLRGICNKNNFLELFKYFILFDSSDGITAKIMAQNHQYLGVKKAAEAYLNRQFNNGKLGVFWHTQGSGKSYSIVFLSKLIREKFAGSPTIVIITDRKELDTQIYNTFENCGLLKGLTAKQARAQSSTDLITKLGGTQGFIFTLIQKFNKPGLPPIKPNHDILLISDEAHRTQNGFFAGNMVDLLPTASRIGFTGTPLLDHDEITARTFGGYVSQYDFARAVKDGATVPLFYENRGKKIKGIKTPEITEKIRQAIQNCDELEDEDEERKAKEMDKLEKEFSKEFTLLRSDENLKPIAEDFVKHYSEHWQCGKAMVVCLDKITCVKMYNYAMDEWQKEITRAENLVKNASTQQEKLELNRKLTWLKETEMRVVVSQEQNEVARFKKWGLDIKPHRQWLVDHESGDDSADKLFKKDDGHFRIVFVCAMWLTGFDCQTLSCLYLYKPLEAHTLMQTIARANRVAEGKENGLIIDYIGIDTELRKALANYTANKDKPKTDPTIDTEELNKNIRELIKKNEDFLNKHDISVAEILESSGFAKIKLVKQAAGKLLTPVETKKTFSTYASELIRLVKYANEDDINDIVREYRTIEEIYNKLQPKKKDFDYENLRVEINDIINENIEVEVDDENPIEPIDISNINFDLLKKVFERISHPNLAIRDLDVLIAEKIDKLLKQNSGKKRIDFYARYQEIIDQFNKAQDKAEIERIFEELMELAKDITEEEQRFVREGFETDEELAVYDLLFKEGLTKEDIKQIKKLAKDVLVKVKSLIAEFNKPFEKRETKSQIDTAIRDMLYSELPDAYDDEIVEKQRVIYDYFYDHYRAA